MAIIAGSTYAVSIRGSVGSRYRTPNELAAELTIETGEGVGGDWERGASSWFGSTRGRGQSPRTLMREQGMLARAGGGGGPMPLTEEKLSWNRIFFLLQRGADDGEVPWPAMFLRRRG